MLWEGLHDKPREEETAALSAASLLMQGVATSIDALSVGFTIAGRPLLQALVCSLIIAAVTFILCWAGVHLGRKAGRFLSGRSMMLGGVILIAVGIEIWASSIF